MHPFDQTSLRGKNKEKNHGQKFIGNKKSKESSLDHVLYSKYGWTVNLHHEKSQRGGPNFFFPFPFTESDKTGK